MMTEEQLARAKFVHDLRVTVSPDWMQTQYTDLPKPAPDHFWLHFTDLPIRDGYSFFEQLLVQDLIALVPEVQYQPRNDWMDHFPPACYRLTEKGRYVLDNPHEYVYGVGETS